MWPADWEQMKTGTGCPMCADMHLLENPHSFLVAELTGFWQDVACTAQALYTLYQPVKINYGVFGNLRPHIHAHLLQFETDDPRRPLNMHEQTVLWKQDEYVRQIARLREALGVI